MDTLTKNRILTPFNLLHRLSPELNARILFRLKCGYRLDLKNPTTYNEKLQWIKLFNHNPLMPFCCDKYCVREYLVQKGCGELLNELLWSGFDPEEIPFDELPDSFVIKVTQGSTFNIIVKDKKRLNRKKAVQRCRKWLDAKYMEAYGEWFYGVERPRVIVERFLDDGYASLRNFKIYCFNGAPQYIGVENTDEKTGIHYKDMYDLEWNYMAGWEMRYPCSGKPIERPVEMDRMLEYAKILSEDFLHARIDFYLVYGQIVFGEITFTNSAGFGNVSPRVFAEKLGENMQIPERKKILLIGPGPGKSKGRGSAYVDAIEKDPMLYRLFQIDVLESYTDGNPVLRTFYAMAEYLLFTHSYSRYELFHVLMASRGSFYRKARYIRFLKKHGMKVIIHVQSGSFMNFYAKQNQKNRECIKETLRMGDLVIVHSEERKEIFEEVFGLPNCVVLPNEIERKEESENGILETYSLSEMHEALKNYYLKVIKS